MGVTGDVVNTMEDKQGMPAAYDDFLDTLACQGLRLDPAVWDDLVDRLAAYDVTYLGGGSVDAGRPSPYRGPADVDLARLVRDLARAPEPRLRDALLALLLRHPEVAATVRAVLASVGPHDPTRHALTARLLAAGALQREHAADWARALPSYQQIDVADLTASEGLPASEEDNGRQLLVAAQELVRGRHRTLDYIDGWEDVARHALRETMGVAAFERIMATAGG